MFLVRYLVDIEIMERFRLRCEKFKEKRHCRTVIHCWQ